MFKLKSITSKQKAQAGAATFSTKGTYGSVTNISDKFGISSTTAYQWANQTEEILSNHFSQTAINVARSNLARNVLTLYTHGHASYEGIRHCLHQLTGENISIGRISQIITEAGERALLHLPQMVPTTPCDVALDEIFGRGHDRAKESFVIFFVKVLTLPTHSLKHALLHGARSAPQLLLLNEICLICDIGHSISFPYSSIITI